MLWLTHEAPDNSKVLVEIRYDSTYAADAANGTSTSGANEEPNGHGGRCGH